MDGAEALSARGAMREDQRDYVRRADAVRTVIEWLVARHEPDPSGAPMRVPPEIAERIIKRLALRGLARITGRGEWLPTQVLLDPWPLEPCAEARELARP